MVLWRPSVVAGRCESSDMGLVLGLFRMRRLRLRLRRPAFHLLLLLGMSLFHLLRLLLVALLHLLLLRRGLLLLCRFGMFLILFLLQLLVFLLLLLVHLVDLLLVFLIGRGVPAAPGLRAVHFRQFVRMNIRWPVRCTFVSRARLAAPAVATTIFRWVVVSAASRRSYTAAAECSGSGSRRDRRPAMVLGSPQ